jgi:hypothetical protein
MRLNWFEFGRKSLVVGFCEQHELTGSIKAGIS